MFNPNPTVQVLPITPRHDCVVIDDALLEPERVVELAAAHRDAFEEAPYNAYPGVELRLPDALSAELERCFDRHARARLHAGPTLRHYSRLAMVTRRPQDLGPAQWICHRDRLQPAPGQCHPAAVLYLFRDEALGGTAFYLPRRPAAELAPMIHDSATLAPAAFAAQYGIAPGYQTGSNAWFELARVLPPRWNRLVFYDGGLFHSGHITAPALLDADPRRGRLTLNGFLTCTRAQD